MEAIQALYEIKRHIVRATDLSLPILHVIIGLMIFLAILGLVRSKRAAFASIAAVQLLNEVNDFFVKEGTVVWRITDSIFDTAYTLAIPMLICVFLATKLRRSFNQ